MKKSPNHAPEESPKNSSDTPAILTKPEEFFLRIRDMSLETLLFINRTCSDGEKWKIAFDYREPTQSDGRSTHRRTVLHHSFFNENEGVCLFLLKKLGEIYTSEERPDYFRKTDWAGNTLMHYAAIRNLSKTTVKLASLGAPLDVFNSKFETPLRIAFRKGQQETGRVLCDKLWEKEAFSASLPSDLKGHYKDCENYRSVLKMAVEKIFDSLSKDSRGKLAYGEFFNFTKPFTDSITDKGDISRIQTVIQLLILSGQLLLNVHKYDDAMRHTAAAARWHRESFGENSELLHGHMMCILLSYLSEEAFPTKERASLVCTSIEENPILKLRQELDAIYSNGEDRTAKDSAKALKTLFKRMCSKSKSTVCSILELDKEAAPKFTILGMQERVDGMFSLAHMGLVFLTQDEVPSRLMMQKQISTQHYYAAVLNMLYLCISAMGDVDLREFCPNLPSRFLSNGSFAIQRGRVPELLEDNRARWVRNERVGTVSELTASDESRVLVSKSISVYGDKELYSHFHDALQKKQDNPKRTDRLPQNQNRAKRLEGGLQEAYLRLIKEVKYEKADALLQNTLQLQAVYTKCLESADFSQHDGEVPASMVPITRKELSLVDELLNMAGYFMIVIGDDDQDDKIIKQMYRKLRGGRVASIDNKKLKQLLNSRSPVVKASILCLHTVGLLMEPKSDDEIEAWLSTCIKEIFKSTIEPQIDRERKAFFEHNELVFQAMAKAFFPLLREGRERKIDELFCRLINTPLTHVGPVIIRTLNHILHAEEKHRGKGRFLMCTLVLKWVLICSTSEDETVIEVARLLWKGVQPILTNAKQLDQLLRDSIVEPNREENARALEHFPAFLPRGSQKNMRFVDSRREGCHPALFSPVPTDSESPLARLKNLRKTRQSIAKIAGEQNYKLEILKIETLILEVVQEHLKETQPDEGKYRKALSVLKKSLLEGRDIYFSARVSGENLDKKEKYRADVEEYFEKCKPLRNLSLERIEQDLKEVRAQYDGLLKGGVVKVGEEFHCNTDQISQAEKKCGTKLVEHLATDSLTTDPEDDEWVAVSAPAI